MFLLEVGGEDVKDNEVARDELRGEKKACLLGQEATALGEQRSSLAWRLLTPISSFPDYSCVRTGPSCA